jgi:hypothetical protein
MRCYEVLHVGKHHTGPVAGLVWRSMPDLRSAFDLVAMGLNRRIEAGR